ncbi:MAG: hypothetical protein AAB519_01630 [Patescibacteria group bacterium]
MNANKYMLTDQRKIILAFFVLFIFSTIFLFWQNEQELDPNKNKSWWTLSFTNPNDETDTDFTIENYGISRSFTYQIENDKKILSEGNLTLNIGEKQTIDTSLDQARINTNVPLSIRVSSGEEKKEIYR